MMKRHFHIIILMLMIILCCEYIVFGCNCPWWTRPNLCHICINLEWVDTCVGCESCNEHLGLYGTCEDDDSKCGGSTPYCVNGTCQVCRNDSDCPECAICLYGLLCFCYGECGGCTGSACSGACQECEDCFCKYKCKPCYDCIDDDCIYRCDSGECCDEFSNTCYQECEDNSVPCVWDMPQDGVQCENFDPTDKSCEDIILGEICLYRIIYRVKTAKCAPCKQDCQMAYAGPCATIYPIRCINKLVTIFYACVCQDEDDEPSYSGSAFNCILE